MEHDFRRTGNPRPMTTDGHGSKGSTITPSTPSPSNSGITGSQNPDATPRNAIGPRRGETGSGNTSVATVPDLGRAMAAADPISTGRVLEALLPPRVRSSIVRLMVDRGTQATGWKGELLGYEWSGVDVPVDELESARATIAATLAPASMNELVTMLTKLRLMTNSRAESQDDVELTFSAYADALRTYPADIVRNVLKTQLARNPFWPAWAELAPHLERFARPRRLLHATVDQALAKAKAA